MLLRTAIRKRWKTVRSSSWEADSPAPSLRRKFTSPGRDVYLCVGKAGRIPRRYRGQDLSRWQVDMGYLKRTVDQLDSPADRFRGDPHVSGTRGGHTLNLHQFARDGIQLLGSLEGVAGETIHLADNLVDNMRFADAYAEIILPIRRRLCPRERLMGPCP